MVLLKRILLLQVIILAACNSGSDSATTNTPAEDTTSASQDQPVAASSGYSLFQTNCQACHMPDEKLIGPPLRDVDKKWKNKKDLYDYIHNPAEYISSGKDQRIVQMHKEYGIVMPAFPYLKEPEIDSILNYINTSAKGQ